MTSSNISSDSSVSGTLIVTAPIYLQEGNTDGVISKVLVSTTRGFTIAIYSNEIADSKVPVHIG